MTLLAVTSTTMTPDGDWYNNPLACKRAGFYQRSYAPLTGPKKVNDGTSRRTGAPYVDVGGGASPSQPLGFHYPLRPDFIAPSTATRTYVMGFALRTAVASNTRKFMGFMGAYGIGTSASDLYLPCCVSVNTDGTMSIGTANIGNSAFSVTFGTSAVFLPVDSTSRWYYVEIKMVVVDGTHVRGELVVDGTTRIPLTASTDVDLGRGNAYPAALAFYSDGVSASYGVCDIYCLDNSGSTNNDYLGDCRVEALTPTADGATNTMGKVGGSSGHFTAITDVGPDGDTSYLRAVAAGSKETFVLSDLASTSGTVKGVQVTSSVVKETSATKVYRGVVRIGSTDYTSTLGVEEPYQGDYRRMGHIFETNPATSAAFTAAEVNAMQAGVTLVS